MFIHLCFSFYYLMLSQNKIIKIAITGPAFSGKSFTSEYLARFFDGWLVPEYAEEYLNHLDREYIYQDMLNIVQGQIDVEKKVTTDAIKEEAGIIFFDSEPIGTKIWCEEKFGRSNELITNAIIEADYHHYLLMRPDIEQKSGSSQESASRNRLFQIYIEQLDQFKKPYTIIQGGLEERLKMAKEVVKTVMV